jgi:hypothetical protein
VLRIVDAPVEPRADRLAVEREREVAERIGDVRGPVVHRARAQRLQLVVVLRAVELERVDAARIFVLDRMEPRGLAECRSILYRGRKAI